MGADQPTDDGGLCLAQLWELRSDVRDRTVVLTELTAAGQGRSRGSVALTGQGCGQRMCPVEPVGSGRGDGLLAALLEAVELIVGERGDRLGAAGTGQMAQRSDGEVVVGVWESVPPNLGEREQPGRSTTSPAHPAKAVRIGVALDPALALERVQMPPYCSR